MAGGNVPIGSFVYVASLKLPVAGGLPSRKGDFEHRVDLLGDHDPGDSRLAVASV